MAKIKDILEIESQRASLEQCRFVNLFQEGTFYRVYEWSAWLCVRYIQQFKTTKRLFKNEDTRQDVDAQNIKIPPRTLERRGGYGVCELFHLRDSAS